MPTYMCKCNSCGVVEERTITDAWTKFNTMWCPCGGVMDMLVEKKSQVIKYRERPDVRAWRKEKGV